MKYHKNRTFIISLPFYSPKNDKKFNILNKTTFLYTKFRKDGLCHAQPVGGGGSDSARIARALAAGIKPFCGRRLHVRFPLDTERRAGAGFHGGQYGVWTSEALQPSVHIHVAARRAEVSGAGETASSSANDVPAAYVGKTLPKPPLSLFLKKSPTS